MNVPITVAYGDGIGPEIMTATLRILDAAGARITPEPIDIGAAVYAAGHTSGIAPSSVESLRRTRVFLKAPITTPQGGGYKSLNVTVRKMFGLYANVRPCIAHAPYVATKHPDMNVVIVRENEEDLYAGIEHRHTDEVVQCLKIVSRPGCERIVRYAFEYARINGRRKVTAFTKDNIMKMTDGLFREVFEEVALEYPDLEHDHWIIDIGTARLADTPEIFDVIVTPNLYGDIISDVAAQIAGSVGLGGSANIGDSIAMFEAIHGSAPDIAGRDIANPSGLLMGAVMMLVHLGQGDIATTVHNAWLRAIEDGLHTADTYDPEHSAAPVGTAEFANAVIARLGQQPVVLPPVSYAADKVVEVRLKPRPRPVKSLAGIDVFVEHRGVPAELARALSEHLNGQFVLEMLSNRGQKVWPDGAPETLLVDIMRCRFAAADGIALRNRDVVDLQARLVDAGIDVVKTEGLYYFDGVPGFSKGQGQ